MRLESIPREIRQQPSGRFRSEPGLGGYDSLAFCCALRLGLFVTVFLTFVLGLASVFGLMPLVRAQEALMGARGAQVVVPAAVPAVSARAVAERVDRYYNHLRTLTAEFTQIYRGAGVTRTESGTLSLLRPGRMRWEYQQPRKKLFLSDGRAVWFYVPGEKQAIKSELKELNDFRSPIAYLLGRAHLEKQLRGLSLASDVQPISADDVVLRGIPRGMENQIGEALLEVDGTGRLVRIVISQTDESVTEYRFSNIRENVGLEEAEFRFVPPPGVDVVAGALSP